MVKNHIKRITAPKTWRVSRKTDKFITKPKPGAHKQSLSTSINTFLKELTSTTQTTKETKYLLTKQEVQINGTRKRSHKHQTGFLDTITIPSLNKSFRVIVDTKGKLKSIEIPADEAKKTIAKITGKTLLKGNKLQINTMNGMNIIVDTKAAKDYKTGDTLILSLPDKKITGHIKRDKGAHAIVFTGKHAGKAGTLEEIKDKNAKIKTKSDTFETNKEYIIITGQTKPEIKLD